MSSYEEYRKLAGVDRSRANRPAIARHIKDLGAEASSDVDDVVFDEHVLEREERDMKNQTEQVEMMICDNAESCKDHCPIGENKPHPWGGSCESPCEYGGACVPAPQPEMMICGKVAWCEFECELGHSEPHPRNSKCTNHCGDDGPCVPVPRVEMMICGRAAGCGFDCPYGKAHSRDCDHDCDNPCEADGPRVPVEPPDPVGLDLDALHKRYFSSGSSSNAHHRRADIIALMGEVKRLRATTSDKQLDRFNKLCDLSDRVMNINGELRERLDNLIAASNKFLSVYISIADFKDAVKAASEKPKSTAWGE